MERTKATKFLRDTLDKNGLPDWHIRLTTDLTKSFLGLTSYKDKTIILNAHHIDTHPEIEVIDTIYHEVAHALLPSYHAHDEVWQAKAKELGAKPVACRNLSFSPQVIDAIRSGADVEVTFESETIQINTPKYKISRLQDKCPTCGKPAKEIFRKESAGFITITLECFHLIIKESDSKSPFESLIFDLPPFQCNHKWNKTICEKCNAKRLYPYQIEGARFLEKSNGRAAIFDQMGLGKTIQALAYLKFNPAKRPFLWVTKSGIKYQHVAEIRRILGQDLLISIIDSSKDPIYKGFDAYVIGYDLFRNLSLESIKKLNLQAVILDECQAIKNPDSSRTQAIRNVVREIPSIIPLSGTPWKNRGNEFFVVLNILDPKLFYSYAHFIHTDCHEYYEGNKKRIGGIADPEKFKKKIAHLAIRRERNEVMPELPAINRVRLSTRLEGPSKRLYKEEENRLLEVAKAAIIDGTEDSSEVKQSLRGFLLIMRQIVGLAKVPVTIEFAKEFLEETDRKLVIFVHHIEVGNLIFSQLIEFCSTQGYDPPLQLTGGLSSEERFEIQQKFNNQHRLLVASTLAAGEGLNLQTCSDCVIVERQWNSANEEQAEGRFIRIGQKAEQVTANYIHAEETIDIDLDSIVEDKRENFDGSMNKFGYKNEWTEESVIDSLIRKLTNKL